ncbi:MAG: patatin-like phospholipase family protein [Spirochaetia bacterium]|nr:patatin-like phospholipase family protein [Spirochaetia bacterium]
MRKHSIVMILITLIIPIVLCGPLWAQDHSGTPRPSVALVLEGGGALGFAHIGVIKVIEELGIPIDLVVGTSMGATVGGFYALGYDSARLEEISLSIDWDDIFSEKVTFIDERYLDRIDQSRYFARIEFDSHGFKVPSSLLTGRKMLYYLDRLTLGVSSPTDFDSLPRRFRAVATDLATGERVVIDHGSLSDAMRASMGIPGILAPYRIGDKYLVDGAIVDNLPVSVARELGADLIIAVNLVRKLPFEPESLNRNPLETMSRSIDIMIRSNVQRQLLDADLAVKVDVRAYDIGDYQKALEIIALGKKAAEELHEEFDNLKTKLGEPPDYTADIHRKDQTPILKVNIKGADKKDRDRAHALFAPFVGKILVASDLKEAVEVLEARGSYEYIRLRRTTEESVPTLTVTLQKRKAPGHSIRLGIDYNSTYSSSNLSNAGISFSLVFRSLITENSRLTINAKIMDSTAFELIMLQPFGVNLFAEGFFMARQETDAFYNNSSTISLQQTEIIEMGINLGANPVHWAELAAGVRYQLAQASMEPIVPAGDARESVFIGNIFFSSYQLDSPIFPTAGFSILSSYDQSLTQSGSSSIFRILNLEGLFIPDFNIPLSFTLWTKAGTDFSEYADAAGAAPLYHKPNLYDRQFFPGPLGVRERIGSHIASVGAEIKYQLKGASWATGFPFFLLLQASQGTVLQDVKDIERPFDFTHWTGTVGLGGRLNDGFGALFRVGGTYGFDEELHLFIAFDMGSLGNRKNSR